MGMMENILDSFSPGGVLGARQRRADIDATQQQTQIRKQQAERDQQQFHMDALDKYLKMGATPVGPGDTVHQRLYDTSAPADMPDIWTLKKADPSRTIAIGDGPGQVKLQLPTDEEVHRKALYQQIQDVMGPTQQQVTASAQQQAAAGTEANEKARTRGAGAGVTAAKVADFAARKVPLDDNFAKAVGIPPGTMVLPEERDALTEKYNLVRGAQTRNDGAANRQQASIAAKASGVKATHVTVGPGGAQSVLTVYNNGETEETPMDATSAVKPTTGGTPTPGQQGVQNRFQQRIQANDAKAHEALQSKEQQLWQQHAAIGDVLNTPDGQTFVDPTSRAGKEIQMNYAQRLVFKNRYQAAEDAAKQAQQDAVKIRQKWGWGEFAPGAQQADPDGQQPAPAAGGAPAQSAPPPSAPRGGAAPAQSAPLPQSAPTAAAPNFPPKAGADGPTTVRPFKIGQTVYGKDGIAHKVSGYDNAGKVLLD